MRLLVLGGTWFVGRVAVADALQRGWDVTTFNRGRSGAPATGVTAVHGDREDRNDLARLAAAGPWDAVVDVAGSVPTVVRDGARALQGAVDRYVFISTVSAYRDWPKVAVSEDSEVHSGDPDLDPGFRHWDAAAYGPLRAGCEAAIAREFDSSRMLTVRPVWSSDHTSTSAGSAGGWIDARVADQCSRLAVPIAVSSRSMSEI